MQILIYGYGNPGRQDDGLGIALTQRLEAWVSELQIIGVEFDNNYQLNIEDAAAIAQKDLVIFADASEENIEDFCLSKVDGSTNVSFTTHAASPGYIVQLCKELFQKEPLVLLMNFLSCREYSSSRTSLESGSLKTSFSINFSRMIAGTSIYR